MENGSPSPTLPEREGATRGQVCLMVNGNGKWKMKNGKLWGAFLIAGLTRNHIRLFL